VTSIDSSNPVVITPAVMTQSLITDLNGDQSSMATLENQVSSGDTITVPSDNPAGAASLLQLQSSLTRANQYSTNAADGLGWLQLGNSTVNSILGVLQNVESLVESTTGEALSGSASAVSSIASQVSSSLAQLGELANTQYEGGQAIFAGSGSSAAAYSSDGTYLGAGNAPSRTVAPGTQVSVGVTGPELFGTGSTGLLGNTPGNVGVLAQIISDLNTNTPTSLAAATGTDLQTLKSAITSVEGVAGTLGANEQAVQGFSAQATSTTTTLEQELSSVQSVNMAEAITNLQTQQTGYQAALYATSQISADSLVKYL
jgi:flagellar hook-associated protein 3 FlgL